MRNLNVTLESNKILNVTLPYWPEWSRLANENQNSSLETKKKKERKKKTRDSSLEGEPPFTFRKRSIQLAAQMWRQTILGDNPHSDQSISDEDVDELDQVCPNNVVPLQHASATAANKEELPLPARLDFLKGIATNKLAEKGRSSPNEKPSGTTLEDEIEDSSEGGFNNISGEVVANSSDEEEVISEDEGETVLSTRELHKYGTRFIRHERFRETDEQSEAPLPFKESASCSASHASCSKAKRSGIWSKAKPRIPLSSLSHKIMKVIDPGASATEDINYVGDDDAIDINSDTEPAETETLGHRFNLPSISDLFDNLQDKTGLYFPHDSQSRGKAEQLFLKRSRSHLQETNVDIEDSSDLVGSRSSSDNEVNDQYMKISFPRKKMLTMADRFQEALGTSSVIAEGTHVATCSSSSRAGIFGKLQQVMQEEKERDLDFCKKLQTGAMLDSELGFVDAKIISRYLEGKLTVCHCLFGKFAENFMLHDDSKGMGLVGKESTVIFSARVCDNVDLAVGNLIRIHPPWKEIQVGNDNIILCTYFSQISSAV